MIYGVLLSYFQVTSLYDSRDSIVDKLWKNIDFED